MTNVTKILTVFQGTNPQHRNYIMQCLLGGVPDSYNLYPFKQQKITTSWLPSCNYLHLPTRFVFVPVCLYFRLQYIWSSLVKWKDVEGQWLVFGLNPHIFWIHSLYCKMDHFNYFSYFVLNYCTELNKKNNHAYTFHDCFVFLNTCALMQLWMHM